MPKRQNDKTSFRTDPREMLEITPKNFRITFLHTSEEIPRVTVGCPGEIHRSPQYLRQEFWEKRVGKAQQKSMKEPIFFSRNNLEEFQKKLRKKLSKNQ